MHVRSAYEHRRVISVGKGSGSALVYQKTIRAGCCKRGAASVFCLPSILCSDSRISTGRRSNRLTHRE